MLGRGELNARGFERRGKTTSHTMAFYEGNYGPVFPWCYWLRISWWFVLCKFAIAYNLHEIATYVNFRARVTFTSKICFVRLVRWGLEPGPHRGGVGSECVHRCAIRASLTSKILYFKNCSVQQAVVLRNLFKGCQCYVLLFLKLVFLIHMQGAEAIHPQTRKKTKMIREGRSSLVSRDSVIWLMLILIRGEMTDLGMSRPRNEQRCEKRKEARWRQKA